MPAMNQSDFARHIGRHKSHVTRLKQDGRLVLTATGLVDVDASIARIEATRGQRFDVEDRFAQARDPGTPTATVAAPLATPDDGQQLDLRLDAPQDGGPDTGPAAGLDVDEIGRRTRVAQMLKAEAEARAKERQDLLDAGEIIPRALVRADMATAAGLILAAADILPDRLAPLLVGHSDQATVRAILRDEVEAFQSTVATQLKAIAATPEGAA